MIFLTTEYTVTAVTTVKRNIFFQYFWKEPFDTFDNQCHVLRAVLCDSRDVFVERLRDFFCVKRLRDFFC